MHRMSLSKLKDDNVQQSELIGTLKEQVQHLKRMLRVRDYEIRTLEEINTELLSEKIHLQAEIDALKTHTSPPPPTPGSPTNNAAVKHLEHERNCARDDVRRPQEERDALRDRLKPSVESKAERLAVLEKEVKSRDAKIMNLETAVTELQKKLEHLQVDLASATSNCNIANRELAVAHEEANVQKKKAQDYVKKIKEIEDKLAKKEREHSQMMPEFHGLSLEVESLKSNNHSLETEAQERKTKLRIAEDRIAELEGELKIQDSFVHDYESQISELGVKIAGLESQVRPQTGLLQREVAEMSTVQDVSVTVYNQKSNLQNEVADSDNERLKLDREVSWMRHDLQALQEQLEKKVATIASMEKMQVISQQEALQLQNSVTDADLDVLSLQNKLDTLQAEMNAGYIELRDYQKQAAELSRQVADLRKKITNEHFKEARMPDEP